MSRCGWSTVSSTMPGRVVAKRGGRLSPLRTCHFVRDSRVTLPMTKMSPKPVLRTNLKKPCEPFRQKRSRLCADRKAKEARQDLVGGAWQRHRSGACVPGWVKMFASPGFKTSRSSRFAVIPSSCRRQPHFAEITLQTSSCPSCSTAFAQTTQIFGASS